MSTENRDGPRVLGHAETLVQLADLPGWDLVAGALHGRFDAPDVPGAVGLVADVFDEAEQMGHHPDTDIRWKRVRFALRTHSAGGVTQLDVELAHRIEAAAAARGATRLTSGAQGVEIGIDTADHLPLAPFWRAALGYRDAHPDGLVLEDPRGSGPQLWFQVTPTPASPAGQRGRLHVDVTVATLEEAEARRRAVAEAGGRLLDDSHAPAWWVYADADGNEVCICTLFGREGA